MQVIQSYTLEASFCGMDFGPNKGYHLDTGMLLNAGKHLAQTVQDLIEPNLKKIQETYEYLLSQTPPTESESKQKKKCKKKPKKKTLEIDTKTKNFETS